MRIVAKKWSEVVLLALTAVAVLSVTIPSMHLEAPVIAVNPDGVIAVPIDALAVNTTKGTALESLEIPKMAKELHGRRVRIQGVMWPTWEPTGLREFSLILETNRRAVGWTSGHFPLHAFYFPVHLAAGQSEAYQEQPISVEGRFEVHIQADDTGVYAIYRLTDARIVAKKVRLHGIPAIGLAGC